MYKLCQISPEDCHLDVVGVLARSNEPESYAGWTSRGPGDRSKVRGQTKSNLPALQVWGFCIRLTTLSCKKLLLRKQQRVTYKNHLCRTSLRNPCHGQQWMPRVKTPETLQVIGFEWLTVAKAERKPLSWHREPSAQKQPHWLLLECANNVWAR